MKTSEEQSRDEGQGGPNQILLAKQVYTEPPTWRVPANYTP